MKRLHVELVLALQFDKAHRRPGRRLRDPLGVAIVVLLGLDVGPDIFGRHQPDIVAVGGEHAAEMMSPATGLHPDNARRKLLRQSNQRLPPHLATHHNRAGRIQPNHAADVLAEVDAKHKDIHPFLLLIRWRAYDAGRRGGPFHKTLRASEHDRPDIKQAREEWTLTRQPIMRLEPHRLVFLDETGTTTKMARLRGRSLRGQRLLSKVPFGHWKTQTFIAGLRCDALTAPFVIDFGAPSVKSAISLALKSAKTTL